MPTNRDHPESNAERIYADALGSLAEGEDFDIEELCVKHPKLHEDLRHLHVVWSQVRGVADRLGFSAQFQAIQGRLDASASLPEHLKANYGGDVGPGITLDKESTDAFSSEVLDRLGKRRGAFGRYKIQGEVARGGQGAVLRIWDEDLRRNLAMKVILGKGNEKAKGETPQVDSRTLGRFLEEAQVTGQLDHPGIVPVHELGLDSEGRIYFTMKLVKGRTLREIFDLVHKGEEGWTVTRALGVMLKVCEAMSYAHSKGVIHRDLKPANVMVGRFGEVYVMDWGLARVLGETDRKDIRIRPEMATASFKSERRDRADETPDSPLMTMDGDVVGTPAYMSPEQARGDLDALGPQSDVYAVGAMLYHLLSGQMPYVPTDARLNGYAVWQRVQEGPPKPIIEICGDVPAELEAICKTAMARGLADRYSDMEALGYDLRAFLEGRVVHAYETGAWAETQKWVRRNKPLAGSLAAGILALIAGLVASWVLKGRADELRTVAQANAKRAEENAARADENAATARANADEAERKTADVMRLSLSQDYDDLIEEAADLWPAHPEKIGELKGWIRDATTLTRELPALKSQRDIMELVGTAHETEEEDLRRRWWHNALNSLIGKIESLTSPGTGLLVEDGASDEHGWSVARRLGLAERLRDGFAEGGEFAVRWERDLPMIRKAYPGLALPIQLGLVPIGPDPASKLWEFWDLQSGTEPLRGEDGALVLEESSGLVFVLLAGGRFSMGAQSTNPEGENYDKDSPATASPVHEVELSAFFISKYEMTQGQWMLLAGRNPSHYGPTTRFLGHQHDLTHPVEQVSWFDCVALLPRFGLVLPSEAQWEYAARAGSTGVWWTGSERESLLEQKAANLADQAAARAGATYPSIKDWPELDDGFATHAPVDRYAANLFGLHSVHGNVWEWCLDGYDQGFYGKSPVLDPLNPSEGAASRVYRGGSFNYSAISARSAGRGNSTPPSADDDLGLRPARVITK